MNLSRHRRHTIIFDVQNPAHLDRNIISEADVVLVKEPGPLTQGFERPQLRPIMDSARAAFGGVGRLRRKKAVWVYAPNEDVILSEDVPRTTNQPWTCSAFPLSNFTVTPGSIVNVAPEDTTTCPVAVYGLLANVHVVSVEMVPDIGVAADT